MGDLRRLIQYGMKSIPFHAMLFMLTPTTSLDFFKESSAALSLLPMMAVFDALVGRQGETECCLVGRLTGLHDTHAS